MAETQADHTPGTVTDEMVAAAVVRMRVRDEARRVYDESNAAALDLPTPTRLSEFLSVDDPEVPYRFDGLWPIGGNVVLAAQFKAGKTTLIGNVLRCLVDGGRFLDAFGVVTPARRVVLIDDELDERTLRRWLRDQGISHTDRVEVLCLRGKVSAFELTDDATLARWAESIGPCDVLILDCLRPVLDALGLDENKDAGKLLVRFDELKAAVGASEALIVHHMGHSAERSRGDSRILDWPDVTWKLVREDEDPASARYLSAFGRDVNVQEGAVTFDATTRRLTYSEGSRQDARRSAAVEDVKPAVLGYVHANPGCSGEEISRGVQGGVQDKRAARERLVDEGLIVGRPRVGRGGGIAYHPVTPSTPSEPRRDEVQTPSTPVYKTGLGLGMGFDEPRQLESSEA